MQEQNNVLPMIEEYAEFSEESFKNLTVKHDETQANKNDVISDADFNIELDAILQNPNLPQTLKIAYGEFKDCINNADNMKVAFNGAKTKIKKDYIKKKIAKNEKYATQILMFIERYNKSRNEVIAKQNEEDLTTTCEPQVV